MRFTLQHLVFWLTCCVLLAGVNFAVGGHATLFQGMFTLIVCGIGALWGIRRFKKKHPDVRIAPAKPLLKGIAGAAILSLVLGVLFDSRVYEVCTRTHRGRITRYWGILSFAVVQEDDTSRYIADTLQFHPQDPNWVPVTEYSLVGIGDWMPSFKYPMLNLELDDLRLLSMLKPVEKTHSVFLLDNPLDCKFAHIRDKMMWELRYRLGQNGGTRRSGTDEEILNLWWRDFEPLLRPLHSNNDLKDAIAEYRTRHRSKDFDSFTQSYFDQELTPFAAFVGLPP